MKALYELLWWCCCYAFPCCYSDVFRRQLAAVCLCGVRWWPATPPVYRERRKLIQCNIIDSDVTNVGVTWCGNWWCHLFYLKTDDLSVTVLHRHHSHPRRFPADRLSTVLVNSTAKNYTFIRRCHPRRSAPRSHPSPQPLPPSSDATDNRTLYTQGTKCLSCCECSERVCCAILWFVEFCSEAATTKTTTMSTWALTAQQSRAEHSASALHSTTGHPATRPQPRSRPQCSYTARCCDGMGRMLRTHTAWRDVRHDAAAAERCIDSIARQVLRGEHW